jgi:hypothetical protein
VQGSPSCITYLHAMLEVSLNLFYNFGLLGVKNNAVAVSHVSLAFYSPLYRAEEPCQGKNNKKIPLAITVPKDSSSKLRANSLMSHLRITTGSFHLRFICELIWFKKHIRSPVRFKYTSPHETERPGGRGERTQPPGAQQEII